MRNPLLVIRMLFFVYVSFELKAGGLQVPKRCQRRRGKSRIAVHEGPVWEFKSQRAKASFIMHA